MASMRPRHKAAENRAGGMPMMPLDEIASMRPRHKAAENLWASRLETGEALWLQ